MSILYLYEKCSTCQKALRFLEHHQILYQKMPIKDTPPKIEEIERMLKFQDGNLKKLFNTSGLLYKSLRLQEKWQQMKDKELIELLSGNGMLIKRPFLLGETFGLLGFKESAWIKAFNL
jgi:arsenate reductase (glutaredoxin)